MQTFLPYPNFQQSAKVLDRQRLGKQRVEAYQILRTLTGESNGWKNHPAVKMWVGYEAALATYALEMCNEWKLRGYNDTLTEKITEILNKINKPVVRPYWSFDDDFNASHRSNLLRKNSEWYSQFGWTESDNLPYVWPR